MHLGQQGRRWVSALMAPKHAVEDMQPRVLCTNTSHNQYILQLIQRRACVPESLPVCLFFPTPPVPSIKEVLSLKTLCLIFLTTLATLPPKFKVSGLKSTLL